MENLLKGHPGFENFIKVRIEQAILKRELENLETTMEGHDRELFQLVDTDAIEQATAQRIAFRERRDFLRMAIIEQEGKVQAITKHYLTSIMGILRVEPTSVYREFMLTCLEALDHVAITETDRQELTEEILCAFGKE